MKLPTSEDLLRSIISDCNLEPYEVEEHDPELYESMTSNIREHVNNYVQAALKKASEVAAVNFAKRTKTFSASSKRFEVNGGDVYTVEKGSILEAYPKELII